MVSDVSQGSQASSGNGESRGLSEDQRGHLYRVLGSHDQLISRKYTAGQKEHGGNCWQKPGMLAHALDECADLPVYLWTLREQLLAVAERCDLTGRPDIAAEIRRVVQK